MCSHAGHSNHKQPIGRLQIEQRDFDENDWMNVMQKSHHLASQRQQQEDALSIQAESEFSQLVYPQSFINLQQQVKALKKQQTLKIKTASAAIKADLSAAARLLQCKIEDIVNDQYLYLTRV